MSSIVRTVLRVGVAAALLGLCVPAGAQWTGSRMGKTVSTGTKDVTTVVNLIGKCMGSHIGLARIWLNTLPGSKEEVDFFNARLGNLEQCMQDTRIAIANRELTVDPAHLRHPIAIEAARRILDSAPADFQPAKDSPPWFDAPLKSLGQGAVVDRADLGLQDFGHCVATTNWTSTRAFLKSKPDSREQADALKGLVPTLGPCMPVGTNITLTPAVLRVALSEPAFHIVDAAIAGRLKT